MKYTKMTHPVVAQFQDIQIHPRSCHPRFRRQYNLGQSSGRARQGSAKDSVQATQREQDQCQATVLAVGMESSRSDGVSQSPELPERRCATD